MRAGGFRRKLNGHQREGGVEKGREDEDQARAWMHDVDSEHESFSNKRFGLIYVLC